MKANNSIGISVRHFLGEYLTRQKNASENTIKAYRDTLKMLLIFSAKKRNKQVANLLLTDVNRTIILQFLEFIELERKVGITTRNQRLGGIKSFFRCVAQTTPESIQQCSEILAIPIKKGFQKVVDYLTMEEITEILNQIDISTTSGRRNNTLLRFMHNTGARVQEVVNIRPCDFRFGASPSVLIMGKGRKERFCPLWKDTEKEIKNLIAEKNLSFNSTEHIFKNQNGGHLTRFGVTYILKKHVAAAENKCPSLTKKSIHPHTLRHTTAMHLLQSGVDLNTIRCWLGHSSISTTNKYVEIDLEMKKIALEKCAPPKGNKSSTANFQGDFMNWLNTL